MARKKSTRPLGMPGNRALRHQAMQIAKSSVTPASQIRRQYGRAQTDAAGFTDALVSLLQGQQSAYNGIASDSQAQQASIDNAAVSRLGGLGDYSQGAMGATGALGTSAETRTNTMGTALRAFGAQQPGIAGSRGLLTKESLNNALQDALDQRRTQVHQAFLQAYPQVQQNAFSQRLALANLGLQQSQLAQQAAYQNASLGLQAQSLSERNREFNIRTAQSDQQFWAQLSAQYGGKGAKTQPWKHYNMTPTQWRNAAIDARQGATQAEFHGATVEQYLDKALKVNLIPPELALKAVKVVYGGLKGANKKTQPAKYKLYQDYIRWLQEQPAYRQAQEMSKQNQRNRQRGARGPASGE